MANPPIEVPAELLPKLGDSIKGWNHANDALASDLPTSLRRANLVRRGAVAMLNTPKRPKG